MRRAGADLLLGLLILKFDKFENHIQRSLEEVMVRNQFSKITLERDRR